MTGPLAFLAKCVPASVKRILRPDRTVDTATDSHRVDDFAFNLQGDARADILAKYHFDGELLDLFVDNRGPIVHKWHHYIPLYDRYFARFRDTPVRFLEIGVSQGGSIRMWREYFGAAAVIFGIDINPACRRFDGQAGRIRIGSQVDTDFLDGVIREMGGIDIVLDDGSHHMDHIPVTLQHLFPLLADGGIYMIEDLHTAYWKQWGGGVDTGRNFFRVLDGVVDDMHRWYHDHPPRSGGIGDRCSGVHVHDSMVVLDKSPAHRPTHSMHG